MTVVYLFLLLLAAVCFLAHALGRNFGRPDRPIILFSLGLFFWVLVPLIQAGRAVFHV